MPSLVVTDAPLNAPKEWLNGDSHFFSQIVLVEVVCFDCFQASKLMDSNGTFCWDWGFAMLL